MGIDDTTEDSSYRIYYAKFDVIGVYDILFTTLKEFLILDGGSEDVYNIFWNEILSKMVEPCTEEEYYSHFTKTVYDYQK